MTRRLSEDPERRRLQLFRAIFINYYKWQALVESEGVQFLAIDGEEIYFYDLLVGLDDLPPRQRQAFELHLLFGMTEKEAAAQMGFTKWVTLVGQYSTAALKRMVVSYDTVNTRERGSSDNTGDEVGSGLLPGGESGRAVGAASS